MKVTAPYLAAALAALTLSGCGNATNTGTIGASLFGRVAATVTGDAPAPTPQQALTRAAIEASPTPLILVTVPNRNASATMTLAGQNAGKTTWITNDGIGLTLRNGLLIATRGLGEDLMAVDGQPIAAGVAGSGRRIHDYLTGTDRITRPAFSCQRADKGMETIRIVERSYTLRHIEETCVGDDFGFINSYWVDQAGKAVSSTQFVSPSVGYLQIWIL